MVVGSGVWAGKDLRPIILSVMQIMPCNLRLPQQVNFVIRTMEGKWDTGGREWEGGTPGLARRTTKRGSMAGSTEPAGDGAPAWAGRGSHTDRAQSACVICGDDQDRTGQDRTGQESQDMQNYRPGLSI